MIRLYTILLLIILTLTLTSCASTCEIFGSNRNPQFEEKTVAVVANDDSDFEGSEETISHGTFLMVCSGGAPQLCRITVEGTPVGYVVVEDGKLDMDLDNNGNAIVSGTKLNNILGNYLLKMNAIDFDISRLDLHYTSATLFNGDPGGLLYKEFQTQYQQLINKKMELQTEFITRNFDNVLGKNFFLQLLSEEPTPERKAQIEKILHKAPKHFKQDEEVKKFLHQVGLK